MSRICVICGQEFDSWDKKRKTCSRSCSRKLGIQTRRSQGNYTLWNKDTKDKIKQTKLERYGNCNYNNSSKANITKSLRTNEEKAESVTKSRETRLQRYGSETYNNSEKIKETCLERYGCINPMQVESVKQKARDTCRDHYGVDYFFQSEENKTIINDLLKDKNIKSHVQQNFTEFQKEVLNDKERFIEEINKLKFEERHMNNLIALFKISRAQISWRIRKWNLESLFPTSSAFTNPELEILEVLRNDFGIENIQCHCRDLIRNPENNHILELDFYLPDYNLAIEYNGFHWHDKENQVREYIKTEICEGKGIKLLHIWEDDWYNHRDKILIKLNNLLQIDLFDEIESIEEIEVENTDVYDIEVPEYHNFVLANNLVVHNSADTLQQFIQAGFNAKLVSLDKSPNGYLYLKASINEKRISMLDLEELNDQLINLEQNNQTGKIDHPINGEKDVADGICGALYNASQMVDRSSLYVVGDYQSISDTNDLVISTTLQDEVINSMNSELKQEAANTKQPVNLDSELEFLQQDSDKAAIEADRQRLAKIKSQISQADRHIIKDDELEDSYYNGKSSDMLIW